MSKDAGIFKNKELIAHLVRTVCIIGHVYLHTLALYFHIEGIVVGRFSVKIVILIQHRHNIGGRLAFIEIPIYKIGSARAGAIHKGTEYQKPSYYSLFIEKLQFTIN